MLGGGLPEIRGYLIVELAWYISLIDAFVIAWKIDFVTEVTLGYMYMTTVVTVIYIILILFKQLVNNWVIQFQLSLAKSLYLCSFRCANIIKSKNLRLVSKHWKHVEQVNLVKVSTIKYFNISLIAYIPESLYCNDISSVSYSES